jgi:hypothetical protein
MILGERPSSDLRRNLAKRIGVADEEIRALGLIVEHGERVDELLKFFGVWHQRQAGRGAAAPSSSYEVRATKYELRGGNNEGGALRQRRSGLLVALVRSRRS